MQLQGIFEDCGLPVGRYEAVHGGDINHAFCLHTSDGTFFLKVNDAERYPEMFEKEARGLEALRAGSAITIPDVLRCGEAAGQQYLLLQWMEKGQPRYGMWERFGTAVAVMHRQAQPFFGWLEDNYIGSLVQQNGRFADWAAFYAECRIMPLVQRLAGQQAFTAKDVLAAERLCHKLATLFPAEPPALLHGDLWAGNYMVTTTGDAALYDPAVYYGHREMDIGMTRLFGGFDSSFYEAYNTAYPLAPGWQQRLPLTQLYPLLVHAVLFGGGYVERVREIVQSYF